MPEIKELTDKQLMDADVSTLTNEQIQRKINLISLHKMEREMALTNFQNQKFEDDEETRKRMLKQRMDDIESTQARVRHEQSRCRHMTGGMDKPGFFNGDGDKYGTCTALLKLPTGEVYVLCFRCQKEWHMPSKRDVIDGKISLAQFVILSKEYNAAMAWPRKSFAPWNGEICEASQFHIPKLIQQKEKDNIDFNAYVAKLDPTIVNMANQGVEPGKVGATINV